MLVVPFRCISIHFIIVTAVPYSHSTFWLFFFFFKAVKEFYLHICFYYYYFNYKCFYYIIFYFSFSSVTFSFFFDRSLQLSLTTLRHLNHVYGLRTPGSSFYFGFSTRHLAQVEVNNLRFCKALRSADFPKFLTLYTPRNLFQFTRMSSFNSPIQPNTRTTNLATLVAGCCCFISVIKFRCLLLFSTSVKK